jgi:cbb3-type cytochrome oxidase maturation protein
MTGIVYLIPIALLLGLLGLAAFLWALRSGQFEDLDGAASRILYDDDDPPDPDPPDPDPRDPDPRDPNPPNRDPPRT